MASEAFSVVAHSCSPSNGEAETGGWQVLDYPGLHDNTPASKKISEMNDLKASKCKIYIKGKKSKSFNKYLFGKCKSKPQLRFFLFWFCFLRRWCLYAAQAGLRLAMYPRLTSNSRSSCLSILSAGLTGVSLHN
jgi:hypothetical protein